MIITIKDLESETIDDENVVSISDDGQVVLNG